MKRMSLRAELRLWSALLAAAILLVVSVGVAYFLRSKEIEELDHQLDLIGTHFFAVYRKNGSQPSWVTPEDVESIICETSANGWFVEVLDSTGLSLYRSPSLIGCSLDGSISGISNFDAGENGIRLGVYQENGLTFRVGADLDEMNELSSSLLLAVAIVFPAVLGIIFFGARWLAARALAPVAELTAAAERVSAQSPSDRLPIPTCADELARLAHVLNATFDRLGSAFSQASRFSGDASHEFRTPLAIARAGLERMIVSPTLAAADRDSAAAVLDELRRINHITQTLLLLSRADAGQLGLRPVVGDLAQLVCDCAEDAQVLADTRGITLKIESPAIVNARFDADRTTLVLQNLFENAVKYNCDGGSITVRLCLLGEMLSITIANTGRGILPADIPQLFARFFRASVPDDVPGHGLGLSLARELARAQGGDLILGDSGDVWTAFIFTAPTASGRSIG